MITKSIFLSLIICNVLFAVESPFPSDSSASDSMPTTPRYSMSVINPESSPDTSRAPSLLPASGGAGAGEFAVSDLLLLNELFETDLSRLAEIQFLVTELMAILPVEKHIYLNLILSLLTFDHTQYESELFSPQEYIETIFNIYKIDKTPAESYQLEIKTPLDFKLTARKVFFLRVVHTLIENAFKYSHTNVRLKLELSEDDSTLIFSTSNDTNTPEGMICEEMWEKLFDIGVSESKKGTTSFGYGLPSSRLNAESFVDRINIHGSEVRVSSSSKTLGTEFQFKMLLRSSEDLTHDVHSTSTMTPIIDTYSSSTSVTSSISLETGIAHEVNNLLNKFLYVLDFSEEETTKFQTISQLLLPILKPIENPATIFTDCVEKKSETIGEWIEKNDPIVWIVDDIMTNIRIISKILCRTSISKELIHIETDPLEALQQIKSYMDTKDPSNAVPRPILILADERMGAMNGSELMKEVFAYKNSKTEQYKHNILFVSISGEPINPFEGLVLFRNYRLQSSPVFITKPVSLKKLLESQI